MFFKILRLVPLMVFVLIAYNLLVVFKSDDQPLKTFTDDNGLLIKGYLDNEIFSATMMSGATWTFTIGHLLILAALVLLFFEIVKATQVSAVAIADHAISMLIFIAFLIEFLLVEQAGSSVFLILMVISLIDVIGGYIIGIRVARRDLALGGGGF